MAYVENDGLTLLGIANSVAPGSDSSVRSPTSTTSDVRSPTRTSTEVRSPTRTSTETEAHTTGNFTATVTGGAGAGANTTVTINLPGYSDTQQELASRMSSSPETRAARDGGTTGLPSAARSQMSTEDLIMGSSVMGSSIMGALNDKGDDEFDNQIEDEDGSIYPTPGVEIGALKLACDRGSGSYAEDGRLEVAEDKVMENGEAQVGSAAMYGPTEIGQFAEDGASEIGHQYALDGATEIGLSAQANEAMATQLAEMSATINQALQRGNISEGYAQDLAQGVATLQQDLALDAAQAQVDAAQAARAQAQQAAQAHASRAPVRFSPSRARAFIGQFAQDGASEIGAGPFSSHGASEIGLRQYALDGASEIGRKKKSHLGDWSPEDQAKIGSAAMYGPTEIGGAWSPEEGEGGFVGGSWSPEEGEGGFVGNAWSPEEGEGGFVGGEIQAPFESFMLDDVRMGDWSPEAQGRIGAAAVTAVVAKARDNRQPSPPLKAVDADSPSEWPDNWTQGLTDVVVGVATATGSPDPFPLTSQFMLRCGAGMEPRYVRVDTESSYKKYRQDNSPEIQALHAKLNAHIADQHAHESSEETGTDDELFPDYGDADDIVMLGAAVDAAEKDKEVDLWMPRHFDGQISAWREGEFVCSSMRIPGFDGEVRICTTLEPLQKCINEMSRHAVEAGVPASTVVGVLPAMGCVLGAGTGLKEMSAAAPSIATRPEMKQPGSFVVRIEPKASPALCALAMLVLAVEHDVPGASDEWTNLVTLSPAPVKQAMGEAIALVKAMEK